MYSSRDAYQVYICLRCYRVSSSRGTKVRRRFGKQLRQCTRREQKEPTNVTVGGVFLFFENRCKHLFRFLTRGCVWCDIGRYTQGMRGRWRHRRYRGKGLYTSLTRADTAEGKPSIISAVNEMCQRWRMYVTRGVRLADAADYPAREKNPGKVEERRVDKVRINIQSH